MRSITYHSDGTISITISGSPDKETFGMSTEEMIKVLTSNGFIVIDPRSVELSRFVTQRCPLCAQPVNQSHVYQI